MKRLLGLVMAMMMVLCLAACGESAPDTTECASLQELSEKINCAMITPENVLPEDEKFTLIEGEPQIAEYSFTLDGVECSLRCAAVGTDVDICGIKDGGESAFAEADGDNYYNETDAFKAQRWVTVDGQYVFAAMDNSEWEWDDFAQIQTQFYDMKPMNWTSEVPFEDYKAIEGNYVTEDQNVCSISVVGDHAGVYAVVGQEDGSSLYWEMEGVLNGDRLEYGEGRISKIVFNAEAGNTETTDEGTEPAGYLEIRGDRLVFSGADSELLKSAEYIKAE